MLDKELLLKLQDKHIRLVKDDGFVIDGAIKAVYDDCVEFYTDGRVIRRTRKQLEERVYHFCDATCWRLWRAQSDPDWRRIIKHCLKSIYEDIEKPKNEARKKYVNFKTGADL